MELIDTLVVRVPATLNRSSVTAMSDALADVSRETSRCAVVLQGAEPGVFCSGVDFAALAVGEDPAPAVEAFAGLLLAIRTCSKPVLCIVDGEAAGGGLGVAAAADVIVATPEASFALPELLFGLVPAIVLPYVVERIPIQKLRWIALSSERIDARAAVQIGLVDRVASWEESRGLVASWIRRLRCARPEAVSAWKRMTLAPPAIGSFEGIHATLRRLRDPAIGDRLRRFIEDGEPPWAAERS